MLAAIIVGIGVLVVMGLGAAELSRRAVLGRRMESSLEELRPRPELAVVPDPEEERRIAAKIRAMERRSA